MPPLVFATYLAPCNRPLYEFAAAACGGVLIDGIDWRELAARSIDVAFVCSPPLLWLDGAVEAIAAPVLCDPRYGRRPHYSSEVVVGAGSPHRSLAELRGARWAYNEPSSWSGYWAVLERVGAWNYFGEVVAAGYHSRALRMVAEGRVEGAAIDWQVLAMEPRDHPELAGAVRAAGSGWGVRGTKRATRATRSSSLLRSLAASSRTRAAGRSLEPAGVGRSRTRTRLQRRRPAH